MVLALVSVYTSLSQGNVLTFTQCAHVMFATCAIGGIHYGTGRHMDTLSDEQIFMAMRVRQNISSSSGNANVIRSTGGYVISATAWP